MLRRRIMEFMVGLFVLGGLIAMLVLAFQVSGLLTSFNKEGYLVSATFENIGGLKLRAPVSIAGVRIGKVVAIDLNPQTYEAKVTIFIKKQYEDIPVDSSARILTEGLLGSNYISISPGFKNQYLQSGDKIASTNSAFILENLIGRILFSMGNSEKKS